MTDKILRILGWIGLVGCACLGVWVAILSIIEPIQTMLSFRALIIVPPVIWWSARAVKKNTHEKAKS